MDGSRTGGLANGNKKEEKKSGFISDSTNRNRDVMIISGADY